MPNNTNILKWYPFKENSNLLEIYNENSIMEKLEKNINIEKCSITKLKLEGEYDYITLIGTYEYAPTIYEGNKPYSDFLKDLKKHLKPDGKILLAIDNRLGIKYFAGAKNKHYNKLFEVVESEVRQKKPNLLLKRELEKFINEAEFKNYKFYYPVPDYFNTNTIFTDDFLPKSNHSKIVYPVNYDEESIIIFNEINVMKQICDNNKFADFTNSYLVEISNEQINNDIKFINYNIFRKDKYKLALIMGKENVQKHAETQKAKKHIENISKYIENLEHLGFKVLEKVEKDKIISKIANSEELDKKIVSKIKEENIEEAYREIENWYSYIKQRLQKEVAKGENVFEKYKIEIPKDIKEKMEFVKNGYIDLSFENVFCEDEYVFYDQEWYFENVPLEFILYRAINNLYNYNVSKIEQKLNKENMLEKFNLTIFTPYFEKLESKIQKEILDEETVNKYRNRLSKYNVNLQELNTDNKELTKQFLILKEQNEKLAKEKEEIENEYNILLNEYNTSRAWKVIKGFRSFLGRK
ncbi:MAG: hypothetical protein HFJ42_04060 [Clostridia bacterium]|nr:hypothetical protein [Clostridia bacterium]